MTNGTRTIQQSAIAGRAALILLLGVAFSTGTGPVYADASEPNDTLETATPIVIDGFGSVRVGGFVGDGPWANRDVDIYRFEIDEALDPPVRAQFETDRHGSQLDGYVRLFDTEGAELAGNDDREFDDVDARIATYLLRAGTYYVGVSSSGNAFYNVSEGGSGLIRTVGAYSLTVTIEDADIPVSRFEPNDDEEDVTEMGNDSFEVLGEFVGDGENGWQDRDIYHITLTTPGVVEAVVEVESIGSTLDAVVQVGGCISLWGSCLLGGNDMPQSGDAAVTLGIPQPQELFIMVTGRGHRQRSGSIRDPLPIGSVGPYNLRFTVTPIEVGGEGEPNDSALTALPTTISGPDEEERLEGFVGDGPYPLTRGDRDFYEVILDESALLTVEVNAMDGSDLDPVVAVFDYFGRLLAFNDNAGTGTEARLSASVGCALEFREEQTVYVMVMGALQRFPNDPLVPTPGVTRIEEFTVGDGPGSSGAYSMHLSTQSRCGIEPDGTIDTSTATGIVDQGFYVCSGGRLDDGICERGLDVDMWSIEVVRAPATLRLLGLICGERGYFTIRVFDSDGADVVPPRSERLILEREILLERAGRYYIGFSAESNNDYDPHIQCSGTEDYLDIDAYSMLIELNQPGSRFQSFSPGQQPRSEEDRTLFATRLGAGSGVIDVIDPDSGQIISSFPAPEPVSGGAEGLAYDGTDLFFVGAGRFPNMYRMDPVTGEIIEKTILWSGSGFYSDAVMLGGELFLMDFFDNRLHVIDPVEPRLLRTLPVGAINGIRISGGMGALSKPNRLYVADAFGTGDIHEIRPDIGTVTGTLHTETVRPTALAGIGTRLLYAADWIANRFESIDRFGEEGRVLSLPHRIGTLGGAVATGLFADFNEDGDIDLGDFSRFQECFTGEGGDLEPGCEPGDANGDNAVDQSDLVAFTRAMTGP